jgi:hypothetical protein
MEAMHSTWKRLSQLSLIDAKEPVGLGERSSMNCAAISGARTVKRLTMLSREQQRKHAISRLAQLERELLDLKQAREPNEREIFRVEVELIQQKAILRALS